MRKFTVQLDERCGEVLWRRQGRTWRSRCIKGSLTDRFHYAFAVPWNRNEALPNVAAGISNRTLDVVLEDALSPGGTLQVLFLFEKDIPDGLLKELDSMHRKPWQAKPKGQPAPPSRKKRGSRRNAPINQEAA